MTHEQLSQALGLQPHPEGGAFREIWRAASTVPHPETGAPRSAATAIHFLLAAGEFSALHEVRSDEVWILLQGGPLELHMISVEGQPSVRLLHGGPNGTSPDHVAIVPSNYLQAARPAPGADYCLCCCIVAPGFDFADFAMPSRQELTDRHPNLGALITELTKTPG